MGASERPNVGALMGFGRSLGRVLGHMNMDINEARRLVNEGSEDEPAVVPRSVLAVSDRQLATIKVEVLDP